MGTKLLGAEVFLDGALTRTNLFIDRGIIADCSPTLTDDGDVVFNLKDCVIFPGFVDVHVHLREPGFLWKETMRTGTMAAARGGYTAVCAMPNLNPVPDSVAHMQPQLDAIQKDAVVAVHPYAAITVGEQGSILADMEGLAPLCVAFSDDGKGVQSDGMMREAMLRAKALGKLIVAHCEEERLLNGGYIHDGVYARLFGHKGICSASEYKQVERDLALVRETGVGYHVCHISTKETVALIRKAKADGLDVTCETAPHYLVLNEMCLQEEGRFKMNPPIRSEEDRQALIEGLQDGTIDMIATDHAPHSQEEKAKGLAGSAFGVVGLETAFAVCYSSLVKSKLITLARLVELLHTNPCKRFSIGSPLGMEKPATLTVFDLNERYTIDPKDFISMGKSTPFAGIEVFGSCKLTMVNGEIVWKA